MPTSVVTTFALYASCVGFVALAFAPSQVYADNVYPDQDLGGSGDEPAAATPATPLTIYDDDEALCHGVADSTTCEQYTPELCSHPVLYKELQRACPVMCDTCEERLCHDTGEPAECAELVDFCDDLLLGHIVRKDCPRSCDHCVTTTTATTTTTTISSTTTSATSTITTATSTTTSTVTSSTTSSVTATSTTNTETSTTWTATSSTATSSTTTTVTATTTTFTGTTETTTTATETSMTVTSTTTSTVSSTTMSTTSATITSTTKSFTTTTVSTTTLTTFTATATTATSSTTILYGGAEAKAFWEKKEMVALFGSILAVVAIVGFVVVIAVFRKSAAHAVTDSAVRVASTHGSLPGHPFRKRSTGMVSMLALDAAAKHQKHLWQQAASMHCGGGRRRSTLASIGSMPVHLIGGGSGTVSVSSMPVSVVRENDLAEPPAALPKTMHREPHINSFPPLSDAELLYAVAEEEDEEEQRGGADALDGVNRDDDEYLDVNEIDMMPGVQVNVNPATPPTSRGVVVDASKSTHSVRTAATVHNMELHAMDTMHAPTVGAAPASKSTGVLTHWQQQQQQSYVDVEKLGAFVGRQVAQLEQRAMPAAAPTARRVSGMTEDECGSQYAPVVANTYFQIIGDHVEVVPTELGRQQQQQQQYGTTDQRFTSL